MSSSTRSRLIALVLVVLAIVAWRERSIRAHQGDVDDWPRQQR